MMKQQWIKKFAEHIYFSFNCEKKQIDEYIVDNLERLSQVYNVDKIEKYLSDVGTRQYSSLIHHLQMIIQEEGHSSRIKIQYSPPVHYIYQTNFGKYANSDVVNKYLEKLDYILDTRENASHIYEEFCVKGLNSLGIVCEKTPYKGDEGIDLIGEVKSKFENQLISNIIDETIILLGQVKFYKDKVDAPIIRHFIGDTLYYKTYNKSIKKATVKHLVIGHRGFSKLAIDMAKGHGINIIDSVKLIQLLLNTDDSIASEALRYIDKEYLVAMEDRDDAACVDF